MLKGNRLPFFGKETTFQILIRILKRHNLSIFKTRVVRILEGYNLLVFDHSRVI